MEETKFTPLLEDFEKAVIQLEEVLRKEKNDIVRDSAIKRFELCFELAWKTIKAFIENEHSRTCISPRTCFREAFHVGLIEYSESWMRLVDERNYTVHTYKQELAEWIYSTLPMALKHFQELAEKLKIERASN